MTDKSGSNGNVDGHDGTDEWRYGEIQRECGRGDGLRCCVWLNMELNYRVGGRSEGSKLAIAARLPSVIRKTNTIKLSFILILPDPSLNSTKLQQPSRVFTCVQSGTHQHSSTALHHRVFLQLDHTEQSSMPTPQQQ